MTRASVPLLVLVLAAILRPDLVLDLGWLTRCWALVALVVLGILLFRLFSMDGLLSFSLGASTHALVYVICLLGTWDAGVTGSQIGGLFPFNDTAGYFQDAILLAVGKDFTLNSVRRPLFPGMLAVVLGLTDVNLKLVLIFLTIIVSLSVFLFSKQVARSFGVLVGFTSLFLSFLYYRRFLGTLLTENLGFPLGLLGAALLLRAVRTQRDHVALATYACFVLTMALLARAGAFLVLPALVLYLWLRQSERAWPPSIRTWSFMGAGTLATGAAFGCNYFVQQWTGSRAGALFGNAAHSFYGMAAGYKGWSQVYIDHPELKGVHDSLFLSRIMDAAVGLVERHPLQLIKAILLSFGDFFLRLFGFAKVTSLFQDAREHLGINLMVIAALNVCLWYGLWRLWKSRSEVREAGVLICLFAAMWLSAPFVPPIDADSMRAYAATFPVVLILTSIGVVGLFGVGWQQVRVPERTSLALSIGLSAALILLAVLGPWYVRGTLPRQTVQLQKACAAGEQSYVFDTSPVLAVHLVDESSRTFGDYYPSTRLNVAAFRRNLHIAEDPQLGEWSDVAAGNTIVAGRDVAEGRVFLFVARTSEVSTKKGTFRACGEPDEARSTFVKIHALREVSAP
jgi:hypothetical protein